jgi:hypothetical protein
VCVLPAPEQRCLVNVTFAYYVLLIMRRADTRITAERATRCYSEWREQCRRRISLITSIAENSSSDATAETAPAPAGYDVNTALTVDLFCGSRSLSWDRVRIPVAAAAAAKAISPSSAEGGSSGETAMADKYEGLYVFMLSDAVNPQCYRAVPLSEEVAPVLNTQNRLLTAAEERQQRVAVLDRIVQRAQVVQPLSPNVQIVVCIEPPAE